MTERLDKLISDSGLYSRSEARTLVRAGRVSVDGEKIGRASCRERVSRVV